MRTCTDSLTPRGSPASHRSDDCDVALGRCDSPGTPDDRVFGARYARAHPHRCRRLACTLTAATARLAEKRGPVTPSFRGTSTSPTFCRFAWHTGSAHHRTPRRARAKRASARRLRSRARNAQEVYNVKRDPAFDLGSGPLMAGIQRDGSPAWMSSPAYEARGGHAGSVHLRTPQHARARHHWTGAHETPWKRGHPALETSPLCGWGCGAGRSAASACRSGAPSAGAGAAHTCCTAGGKTNCQPLRIRAGRRMPSLTVSHAYPRRARRGDASLLSMRPYPGSPTRARGADAANISRRSHVDPLVPPRAQRRTCVPRSGIGREARDTR